MKFNIFFLSVLILINNILHNISEKIIIVIFIIIFFLLTKVLNNIIIENYNSRIKSILYDVNTYINVLFTLYYNNKNTLYFNLLINSAFKKLNNFLINYTKKLIKKNFYYLIKSK
jgi:hypothetical protein